MEPMRVCGVPRWAAAPGIASLRITPRVTSAIEPIVDELVIDGGRSNWPNSQAMRGATWMSRSPKIGRRAASSS